MSEKTLANQYVNKYNRKYAGLTSHSQGIHILVGAL